MWTRARAMEKRGARWSPAMAGARARASGCAADHWRPRRRPASSTAHLGRRQAVNGAARPATPCCHPATPTPTPLLRLTRRWTRGHCRLHSILPPCSAAGRPGLVSPACPGGSVPISPSARPACYPKLHPGPYPPQAGLAPRPLLGTSSGSASSIATLVHSLLAVPAQQTLDACTARREARHVCLH